MLSGTDSTVDLYSSQISFSNSDSYAGGIHMRNYNYLYVYGGTDIHDNYRNGISATSGYLELWGEGTTVRNNGVPIEDEYCVWTASGIYVGPDSDDDSVYLYLEDGLSIVNNTGESGGGVFVDSSYEEFEGNNGNVYVNVQGLVTIANNSACWIGGGMLLFMHGFDQIEIEDGAMLLFENNTAYLGGGLFIDAFLDNPDDGDDTNSFHLQDIVFKDNTAWEEGGGAFLWFVTQTGMRMQRTLFQNNTASECGGISFFAVNNQYEGMPYVLAQSTFSGNDANYYVGGGACASVINYEGVAPSDFHFEYNTFIHNTAAYSGGGLALFPWSDDDDDSLVGVGTVNINSNIIVDNILTDSTSNESDVSMSFGARALASGFSGGHNIICFPGYLPPTDESDLFGSSYCFPYQTVVQHTLQQIGAQYPQILLGHPLTPCSIAKDHGLIEPYLYYEYDMRYGHARYATEAPADAGALESFEAAVCDACDAECPTQCTRYSADAITPDSSTCTVDTDEDVVNPTDCTNSLRECLAFCRTIAPRLCLVRIPRMIPPLNLSLDVSDHETEHPMCRGTLHVHNMNIQVETFTMEEDAPSTECDLRRVDEPLFCDGDDDECSDGIDCTEDSCTDEDDDDGICQHVANHDMCDDGNDATIDRCHLQLGCRHYARDASSSRVRITAPPGGRVFNISSGMFTVFAYSDIDMAGSPATPLPCGSQGGNIALITGYVSGLFNNVAFFNGAAASHCSPDSARPRGGAIHLADSSVQFMRCSWYNNTAPYGGALYATGRAVAIIQRNTFANNTAVREDGGGAIRAMCGDCDTHIIAAGTLFSHNSPSDLSIGKNVFSSHGCNIFSQFSDGMRKEVRGLDQFVFIHKDVKTYVDSANCTHSAIRVVPGSVNIDLLRCPFGVAIPEDACGNNVTGAFPDIGSTELLVV
jgi:hypothetical protein